MRTTTHFRLRHLAIAALISTGLNAAEAGGIGFHVGGDIGKALRHIDQEKNRGGKCLEEGVHVAGKTVERQVHAVGSAGKAAGKRLQEGKILDAVWHFHTDQLKAAEGNALRAVQESSALRSLGQIGATTFGPVGAATFSGWYVGRTTKDLSEGLKAGVVSGLSSAALSGVSKSPVTTFGDAASMAIASGTVGGVATVASGGKFEEGFGNAALASGLHSAYKTYTGADPDPRPGTKWIAKGSAASCAGNPSCIVVNTSDDMRKLGPGLKHTGEFSPDLQKIQQFQKLHPVTSVVAYASQEGSTAMNLANKVPFINAGSYAHDMLAIDLRMSVPVSRATIPPVMVGTAMAGGAGRDAALLKTAIEKARERHRKNEG